MSAKVKHPQPLGIADGVGEVGDGPGVVDVTPLGDVRHGQVVGDQEVHHRAVGLR